MIYILIVGLLTLNSVFSCSLNSLQAYNPSSLNHTLEITFDSKECKKLEFILPTLKYLNMCTGNCKIQSVKKNNINLSKYNLNEKIPAGKSNDVYLIDLLEKSKLIHYWI